MLLFVDVSHNLLKGTLRLILFASSHTAWKVSVFRVFLVCSLHQAILREKCPYSECFWSDCGKIRTLFTYCHVVSSFFQVIINMFVHFLMEWLKIWKVDVFCKMLDLPVFYCIMQIFYVEKKRQTRKVAKVSEKS